MPIFSQTIHRNIYLFGLLLLVFSLPLSTFGTSFSQLIILGNWVLEGNFREKINLLKNRKSIWVFISIFIIHALWLLPPQDYVFAYYDLKIKVPLLVLPILIGTSDYLSAKNIKLILIVFVSGVLLGSLISLFKFIFSSSINVTSYRELSVFISHIRFSLMVVFSVFILLFYCYVNKNNSQKSGTTELKFNNAQKFIAIFISFWLIVFLFLLKSLTGLIVFSVIVYLLLIYRILIIKSSFKWLCFIIFLILPALPIYYVYSVSKKFTNIEKIDLTKVDTLTKSGNKYLFDITNKSVENGKLVWVYYCPEELKPEWEKRSDLLFDSKDINGNEVKYTLVRYLTSKDLRKDSVGVWSLKNYEIKAIESGVANYTFLEEWKIYPLVYNALWELYEYKTTGNASGHSLAQRIEYLKAAKEIIKEHFWFGVGTGNVELAFNKQYVKMNSTLGMEWRLRAHNQLITFFLTFGIFGLIWILFALLYPIVKEKGFNDFLFIILFLIIIFSFLNEDTLETQAGLTFFVIFYSIFIFGKEKPGSKFQTPNSKIQE